MGWGQEQSITSQDEDIAIKLVSEELQLAPTGPLLATQKHHSSLCSPSPPAELDVPFSRTVFQKGTVQI